VINAEMLNQLADFAALLFVSSAQYLAVKKKVG
jgi:hypothetical protein